MLFKNLDKVFCSSLPLVSEFRRRRASLSVASMRLGVRRWEYPPARSLLQRRSSSWSCCTAKGRAGRKNQRSRVKQTQPETVGCRPRVSPASTCHFYRVEKRTLAAQAGGAAAAAAAATGSALLEPVAETHQGGLLSWHELTY